LKSIIQFMKIARPLIDWQKQHGRHGLPWQQTRDPYQVWLSEIMLQQTQVNTVLPYYERFLKRFPDVHALAGADSQEVMSHWAGLGYYARARNLHACAKVIVTDWQGQFPREAASLVKLPGIGPSTAAAIAAFCFGQRTSILDGNVKRVFARYFALEGDPSLSKTEKHLWTLAEQEVPSQQLLRKEPLAMTAYTQGLMDLGAKVCLRANPRCATCPLKNGCQAYAQGRTQELPTPKSRKALPTRTTRMLIVHSQGKILLEQRPESGIWGGLWSLPEIKETIAIEHHCQTQGIQILKLVPLAALLHTFTHFKLVIEPTLILATKPESNWLAIAQLEGFGLPRPVQKILSGLYEHNLLSSSLDDNGQCSSASRRQSQS